MRNLLYIILFLTSIQVYSQQTTSFISDFVQRDIFKHATISLSVLEVNGNKHVAGHRPQKSMVPASSFKVLSTFSAIDLLGEEFKYNTVVGYTGELLDDGTLEGDLLIIGSGDPSLGSKHFSDIDDLSELLDKIVKAVKSKGITCISGHVICDDSYVQSPAIVPDWKWDDIANYYGAGAWGLNVHDNLYYIYFQQKPKEGQEPQIRRYGPKVPSLTFDNRVKTGKQGSGDNAYIFGGPSNNQKTIEGTIPAGSKEFFIKGAIPNPPLFFAFHTFHALKDQGVKIDGYSRSNTPLASRESMTEVVHFTSVPLIDIAKKTNEKSDNVYAEALLHTLAKPKEMTDSYGDFMEAHLESLGLDIGSFSMSDGSGLSTNNLISSKLLADFLRYYGVQFGLEKATNLLPLAGEEGTVKYFLQKRSCQGRVWAKSGSMGGVLSYSGYIKAKSGKWLSFAVIVNGFTVKHREVRKQLEDLIDHLFQAH
jgi:D-alanyl-D-alanine carboxypeptidase/D-alanyl-D-alanine-endopeptidase (penicillin-binding protein 4)